MNKLGARLQMSSNCLRLGWLVPAWCAALLLVACGGGGGGGHSEGQPAEPIPSSGYAITAHVEVEGHPEQSGWVRVPPIDSKNWSTPEQVKPVFQQPPSAPGKPGQESHSIAAPSPQMQAVVRKPDGSTIDTAQNDVDANFAPGWSLLYWAAAACFKQSSETSAADPQTLDGGLWVNQSPWRKLNPAGVEISGYYIFGYNSPSPDERSCDTQLLMQETLLCAADHLAQLGDSPGTVTWAGVPGRENVPGITVTIPPQRTDDIFIARDMALNALAHLIRLDTKSRVFNGPFNNFESTCTSQFANLANNEIENVVRVTGSTYFDPVPLSATSSSSDFQAAGKRRLIRKAKVLAAAARLTKDLIERSVQDDLSGAQQRISAETDAHAGARQAWGADKTGTPYQSMRHALRTLFGRLEIGNNADPFVSQSDRSFDTPSAVFDWVPHERTRDDPECSPYVRSYGGFIGEGVSALDEPLLLPSVSARWDDVAPKTAFQAKAVALLDSAGIIMPQSIVDAGGSQVKAAVLEALNANAAANAGYSNTAAFLAEDAGAALSKAFADTLKNDDDLIFALQRVYGAFRLITQPEQELDLDPESTHAMLTEVAEAAGLTLQASPAVDALGGVVVKNGLPREELTIDPLASLSRLQHLSSCGVYAQTNQYSDGPVANTHLEAALGPSGDDVTVFQNPFLLGEGFRRQLAIIAEEAEAAPTATDLADLTDFARLAAAEVRQWAGPGTLLTEYAHDEAEPDVELQNLYLVNISLEDLGVQSNVELGERLLLVSSTVHDSSVIANCLAGLRKTCPPIPDPAGELPPDSPFRKPVDTPTYADVDDGPRAGVVRLMEGLDNQTFKIVYRASTHYNLTPGSFVVLLPKNGSPGQVLGWLRTPDSDSEFFAESYSSEQRTLAGRVFGIGKGTEPARTCTNFASLSLPQEYCVNGMQRDQFVPLANELNSNSMSTTVDDSWKNYLSIAQTAAIKADQLGEQLIKNGLDSDLRKESATEELGNLCGSYVSVDDVKADSGHVTIPGGDSQLAQCVKPDTTDIVYLRKDPFANLAPQEASDQLRDLYCRDLATDPPFCARPGLVSHAGLGFATGSAKPLGLKISEVCQAVTGSLNPLPNTLPPLVPNGEDPGQPELVKASFGNAIAAPWATSQGLANTLQGLRLEEFANNQWLLRVGSRVIMGSDALIADENIVPVGSRVDVWPYCLSITEAGNCSDLANFVKGLFPSVNAPNDPNRTELRSYLEGTIFYMGALAGSVPAGTIRMPVPVANRSDPYFTDTVIPAPVLYAQGYFDAGPQEMPGDPGNLDPMHLKQLYNIAKGAAYTGKDWDNSEFTSMKPARRFSTADELAYVSSRIHAYDTWRYIAYSQAHNGAYLYVDTTNAAIQFDASLKAGVTADQNYKRSTLQAWLNDRGNEFASKDPWFVRNMQEATYLTAPGKQPNDTKEPNPYRYCWRTNPKRGRSVCPHAPVSPIFFYDNGGYGGYNECEGVEIAGLQATIYPKSNSVCWRSSESPEGASWTMSQMDADPCSDGFVDQSFYGNGWFSLAPGLVSRDLPVFDWNFGRAGEIAPASIMNSCDTTVTASSLVDTNCPSFNWSTSFGSAISRGVWQDRLKPSVCSPEERMELFLDTRMQERVASMETLVRVLGLSCLASNQHIGVRLKDVPPTISTVEDINVLEGWLNLFGYDVDQIANVLYLVDVPTDVVRVALDGGSDVGAVTSGDRGKQILDLESKLSMLENGFSSLGGALQQLSDAIHRARVDIQAAQYGTIGQSLSIAGAKIDNDRQRAKAYVSILAGYAKLAVGAIETSSLANVVGGGATAAKDIIDASATIVSGGIDLVALDASDANLIERQQNIADMGKNAEAQAIVALSQTTTGLYQTVNDTITGLKTNNNAALQDIAALKQIAGKATINLVKASGADFMQIGDERIPNHVNTVYRRQFDLTKQRYQLAIDSAKRAAYLARLSIEQRLGVRLDEMHQNVGPLEAPATWVDSVCTVQGVDYAKLREANPGTDAESDAEIDVVKGFANQFIGDYVDKLQQFVQFYNVQYPFVDSNDTAVISLREDLPGSLSQCIAPSANLLLYSDELTANSPDSTFQSMVSHSGWRVTQCTADTCLEVRPGGAMLNSSTNPNSVLAPLGGNGHATLLRNVARPTDPYGGAGFGGAGGTGGTGDTGGVTPISPAPGASVFQTVSLQRGLTYVLSWWDMARSANGTPITMSAAAESRPYNVSIFDANWGRVGGDSFIPAKSVDGTGWSERRLLQVTAPVDGEYHVVFSAGPPGLVGAAVAIANVQLENASGNGGDAGPYEANGATVLHTSGRCEVDSPEQFRTRFTRKCDRNGCYYELNDVLNIDTEVVNQGASSLLGKLAPGNYNYRNNTIAMNVVGTGVIDCSQQRGASCNGSAYVQYDLDHIAYNVPIEDYEQRASCFDFGVGAVKGGKALASERFLTLPLGSSDRDLISQSPFLKPEFSGRPLSGAYRLRIHDEPQLVWRNVDDIQLVMNYGYWSRVARSPGN